MRRRLLILTVISLATTLMWLATRDGAHVEGPNLWYSGGVFLTASNADFDKDPDFTASRRVAYHDFWNYGIVASWHDASDNSFRWVIRIAHVHDLLTAGIFALIFVWAFLALRHATRRPSPQVSKPCAICRYDLTGNVSGVCPECGSRVSV